MPELSVQAESISLSLSEIVLMTIPSMHTAISSQRSRSRRDLSRILRITCRYSRMVISRYRLLTSFSQASCSLSSTDIRILSLRSHCSIPMMLSWYMYLGALISERFFTSSLIRTMPQRHSRMLRILCWLSELFRWYMLWLRRTA